ncbi:preprotein translocase subunit SecG [Pantoea sp. Nvir]|uniref:preprotein translocase subunit SecG n=1 Tax=Pantoea sp. Nvir TaxID=2576760 RepID=UPI001359B696|nr:preprotein translocase subunit SecG [Pantoea sp. Nvir]MXP66431.1 preprotein translocase subunit SecG [Pantoea sp. Nvir]
MYQAFLIVFFIVAIAIVGLIVLQQGKGADMGASFGTGASATLFGSTGSSNFMTRLTGILMALFFIISLVLGNLNTNKFSKRSQWENLSEPAQRTQPTQGPAQAATLNDDIPK